MNTKHHLGHLKLALIVGSLALPLITQAGQEQKKERARYKLIDLGTLGGPSSTVAGEDKSVNNHGTVVGGADTAILDPFAPNCFTASCFVQHAFQWQGGVRTDLGALADGVSSAAHAINSKGQVVGASRVSFQGTQGNAFLWEEGGPMTDLNTLIPANSALHLVFAKHISDRGAIAGTGLPPGVPLEDIGTRGHAFLLIPVGEK